MTPAHVSSGTVATAVAARGQRPPVILLTAPAPMGGLESVVAALAKGLTDHGRSVVLVQLLVPGAPAATPFAMLDHPQLRHECVVRTARDYRGARDAVRAILAEHPGAVLHAHGARADLIAQLAAAPTTPVVSTVHGFVTNSWKQALAQWVHQRVLRRATQVICVSDALLEQLRPTLGARAVLVRNAAPETPLLSRSQSRRQLEHVSSAPLVGWVGRISPEKGLDVFLDALAKLDDANACIVVVGSGPMLPAAKAQAEALGVAGRVRFLGALPAAAQYFPGLDALVLSSRTEGTPMTVLEAMRAQVPVVATAVGGVPTLLRDDCGWLVPADDAAALASALDEVLRDTKEAGRRVERAAHRAATEFSVGPWIDAHERVYAQLMTR